MLFREDGWLTTSSEVNKDESVASWAAGMRDWEPPSANCPKLFGYANKTEGRQSATESLDGLKTHRPGGRVRYVGRGMVLQAVMSNLQVVSQGSWPDQRWKRR